LFPIKAENNPWPQTAANNEKINREPKVVKATLSRTSAWSTIGTSRRSTSSHWKLYPSSHTNRPETHQPQTIQIPNLPYIHNKIITTKHFLKKKKKKLTQYKLAVSCKLLRATVEEERRIWKEQEEAHVGMAEH